MVEQKRVTEQELFNAATHIMTNPGPASLIGDRLDEMKVQFNILKNPQGVKQGIDISEPELNALRCMGGYLQRA